MQASNAGKCKGVGDGCRQQEWQKQGQEVLEAVTQTYHVVEDGHLHDRHDPEHNCLHEEARSNERKRRRKPVPMLHFCHDRIGCRLQERHEQCGHNGVRREKAEDRGISDKDVATGVSYGNVS